ncbi:hypothetical protein AAMO2058_001748100 [Amorphochlora amoebiformis]
MLVVADIEGTVTVTGISEELRFHKEGEIKAHSASCRSLCFDLEGKHLYSCGTDRAITVSDVQGMRPIGAKKGAHSHPINVVKLYDNNTLLTGDDEGYVRAWDVRGGMKEVWGQAEHGDFVSDIMCVEEKKIALVTSGDGTLSSYDMRKGNCAYISDSLQEELLCIAMVKKMQKIICGSSGGSLEMFEFGMIGKPEDRFIGHPDSIDSLCNIDDETLCTGSSDGHIRIVSVHPNKMHGILGSHRGGPVECVRHSSNSERIYSCGHDGFLRVWDLEGEGDEVKEDDDDFDDDDSDSLSEEKGPTLTLTPTLTLILTLTLTLTPIPLPVSLTDPYFQPYLIIP